MELTLPSKLNASETIVLDTNVLVVIGANGAGKSSFGRDLLERYSDNSKKISGMHSLFISSEEPVPVEGNELARLQSMIAERIFMPRLTEYEKLILHLQSEEFEAAVNYKEACKLNPDLEPPVTKIDRIQAIWEKMFPKFCVYMSSSRLPTPSRSPAASITAGCRMRFFTSSFLLFCTESVRRPPPEAVWCALRRPSGNAKK